MTVIARSRKRTVDYRSLVESCACEGSHPAKSGCADIDQEFLCGIMDRPSTQGKLPGFLQSLEELDFHVRAGLLKTWIHSGILNAAVREADFLSMRRHNRCEVRPIDALVAPFGQCNLACLGCYAAAQLEQPSASPVQLNDVVGQLKRLNVHHVLLVGRGEPFYDTRSRQCLFEVVRSHPQIFFSVYSNGTTISPSDIRQLRKLPNLILVLSLDGPEAINDWRRGTGVYRKVTDAFKRMRDQGLLFGYISTVFRQNCEAVLDPQFVNQMAGFGCRLGYYSLFIAPQGADGAVDYRRMMLDSRQREEYRRRFEMLDSAVSMPLVNLDGIEAHVGCRAKRGATVYINAVTGQVSPCIRAPLESAECNIYHPRGHRRLAEILQSEPFRQYRQDEPATQTCEAFIKADLPACGTHDVG